MNKEIKQYFHIWEEIQVKEQEERASQSEHIFSKEFEKKMDTIYEQGKCKKKKKRLKFILKTAIGFAAVFLILICHLSDIQSFAAGWLEEFLHLQIDIIQEDNTGKKTKETYTWDKISVEMKKKQNDSGEMRIEFHTLIDMTEREYWNYLKENELPAEKGPSYVPNGYVLDKQKTNTYYSYVYEEKADNEFDDTKTLSEVFPNTDFVRMDKKKPLKPGKDVIKRNGRNVKLVLREIRKTWKKGKSEFDYYERINDWTKTNLYTHIKSCEKILIGEQEAYVLKGTLKGEDKIYITFYQETSRVVFSGTGEDQEWIYQELMKMIDSYKE